MNNMKDDSITPESIKLLKLLFDNMNIACFVIDSKGVFVDVNSQSLEMTGYRKKEIIGKKFLNLKLLPQEQEKNAIEGLKKAIIDGVSNTNCYTLVRKDKTTLEVEVNTYPMAEGKSYYVLTTIRDISERRREEEELKNSEEKFAKMFKHSPIAMGITSVEEEVFVNANDMFFEKLNYKREDVIGKNAKTINIFADYRQRDAVMAIMKKQGYARNQEVLIRTKSGKILSGVFSADFITVNEKKYILTAMIDITSRKNTEKELESRAQEYEDLYDNSPDMLCSVDAKTARVVKCNKTLIRKTGFRKEEIIGKPVYNLYAQKSLVHAKKVFKTFVESGEIRGEQLQLRRKDGTIMDVSLNVTAVRDSEGKIIMSRSAWRDITEQKKMEDRVRSVAKFPEENPNPVLRITNKGEVVYFSESFRKILKKAKLSKKNIFKALPENTVELIKKVIKTRKSILNQLVEVNERCYSYNLIFIPWRKYINLYGRDVTDQKKAEEKLLVHGVMIDNMNEGISIVGMDGIIKYTNPKYENMFRYKPGEMAGRHVSILNAPSDGTSLKQVKYIIKTIRETGGWQGEIYNIRKDGSCFWSYANVSVFEHPVYGKVSISVQTDITERKKDEEALNESRNKYQSLFASMMNGFAFHKIVTNKKGKAIDYIFLEINDAFTKLTGLKKENVIGSRVTELLPGIEKDTTDWIGIYGKVALTGKDIKFDSYNANLKQWYSIYAYCPKKGHFAAIFENITARRNAEEEKNKIYQQLIQAEKMAGIGTLTAGIAHEFNNLMAIISGTAELGKMNKSLDKMETYYDKILYATERSSEIVKNLATFSKPASTMKSRSNIVESMERVLSIVENQYDKLNIKIIRKYAKIPLIHANEHEIQEVFLNILINARDAMAKKGGTIKVGISSGKKNVITTITDTGCGIKEENIDKLFDPFYITKGALGGDSEIMGTGLGLSVSYGVIKRHKGTIEVESKLKKGTKFTIKLPVKK